MKRIVLVAAAICAVAAAAVFGLVRSSQERILTFAGLGPVRTGMTLAEAEAALNAKLEPLDTSDGLSSEDCWYTRRIDRVDKTLAYMVWNGRIVRVDVSDHGLGEMETIDPRVVTEAGIKIGSTEDEIKAAYGSRLTISTHPYGDEPNDHYIRVLTDDKTHGLLFETSELKVSTFRTGTAEAIELSEGCS